MGVLVLLGIFISIIFALFEIKYLLKYKFEIAHHRILKYVFWINKLLIAIPVLLFCFTLYSFMYDYVGIVDLDLHISITLYYIAYGLILMLLCYLKSNQRKILVLINVVCIILNIMSARLLVMEYTILNIYTNTIHNIYFAGKMVGYICIAGMLVMSIMATVLSFLYYHYNLYELTD